MSRKLDEIKKCLVDAGDYRVSLHDTDMKWLIARVEKLEEIIRDETCPFCFTSGQEALADDSGESTKKEESE